MDHSAYKYKNYLDTLDVYVVSSGGVSSNYINNLLKRNGLTVGSSSDLWGAGLCHTKHVFTKDTKTIYIYGDLENAIYSQLRRNIHVLNMNKIHFGMNKNKGIQYFIQTFPTDPYGIAEQYKNFSHNANTWCLQYPYSKEDLVRVFTEMNIDIPPEQITVKNRTTRTSQKHNKTINDIIGIYEKYPPY